MEGIYPSLSKLQRDMDASRIQRLLADRDLGIQRDQEMEGSIGLVLQSIHRLETRMQATEASVKKEEPRIAPIILMEDNLTKAKRALMKPKELCPTSKVIQSMQNQGSISVMEAKEIAKMQETLIKKER